MKSLILLFAVIKVFTLSCKNQDIILLDEKKFNFGKYSVTTGGCDSGSVIIIMEGDRKIFQDIGGEGMYISVDTINISEDHNPSFIFSYAYEEDRTLGMLVSTNCREKFKVLNITDDLFKSFDCPFETSEIQKNSIKDFVISDIDNDGKQDVITIAYKTSDKSVKPTNCSKVYTHDQLLEILNKR
jgi:hypothetical protein